MKTYLIQATSLAGLFIGILFGITSLNARPLSPEDIPRDRPPIQPQIPLDRLVVTREIVDIITQPTPVRNTGMIHVFGRSVDPENSDIGYLMQIKGPADGSPASLTWRNHPASRVEVYRDAHITNAPSDLVYDPFRNKIHVFASYHNAIQYYQCEPGTMRCSTSAGRLFQELDAKYGVAAEFIEGDTRAHDAIIGFFRSGNNDGRLVYFIMDVNSLRLDHWWVGKDGHSIDVGNCNEAKMDNKPTVTITEGPDGTKMLHGWARAGHGNPLEWWLYPDDYARLAAGGRTNFRFGCRVIERHPGGLAGDTIYPRFKRSPKVIARPGHRMQIVGIHETHDALGVIHDRLWHWQVDVNPFLEFTFDESLVQQHTDNIAHLGGGEQVAVALTPGDPNSDAGIFVRRGAEADRFGTILEDWGAGGPGMLMYTTLRADGTKFPHGGSQAWLLKTFFDQPAVIKDEQSNIHIFGGTVEHTRGSIAPIIHHVLRAGFDDTWDRWTPGSPFFRIFDPMLEVLTTEIGTEAAMDQERSGMTAIYVPPAPILPIQHIQEAPQNIIKRREQQEFFFIGR